MRAAASSARTFPRKTRPAISTARGPLIRSTAIAPSPSGVEMAAMVSFTAAYAASESSSAARSSAMVARVSSPMFERRKVLPFSFP